MSLNNGTIKGLFAGWIKSFNLGLILTSKYDRLNSNVDFY
jgi:hypothetical protein